MRYELKCLKCGAVVWVRGSFEEDTNATVIDDFSIDTSDACEHLIDGGDYEIIGQEPDDRDDDYEGDGIFADNH